jgi:hypothetical protein
MFLIFVTKFSNKFLTIIIRLFNFKVVYLHMEKIKCLLIVIGIILAAAFIQNW